MDEMTRDALPPSLYGDARLEGIYFQAKNSRIEPRHFFTRGFLNDDWLACRMTSVYEPLQ